MSLISVIGRGKPKHRAVDKVAELRGENSWLLAQVVGAGAAITSLENSLADARSERAEANRVANCLTESLEQAERDIKRLQAANRAWEAQYANEHPVSVKAPRDLRVEDDRPTMPHGFDARPLRDLMQEFGPVIPVPVPAEAASPTHIPTTAL